MRKVAFLLSVVLLMVPIRALSQAGSNQTPASTPPDESKEFGGYEVHQSVEVGYRLNQVTGSGQVYDTFINQHDGLRVLDQSFSMISPTHTGTLFDDLTVSSFGWGGDPENLGRVRVSKTRIYDFNFLFRRDRNFFDFDLLANPLNPPTSNPNVPITSSPHATYIHRHMYDAGLTLFPDSKVSVRLGYSRSRSYGPSFSSDHEGTDALLNQLWNVTGDTYQVGFDFKLLPHTNISYDQFVETDKNDTDYALAPFALFPLSNGTLVSFGLPFNTAANSPCAAPVSGGTANANCNGFIAYARGQRVRMTIPTEQLSLQSNPFRRLNIVARASYSSGDLGSPYAELFNGLVTRNGTRQFTTAAQGSTRRVNAAADLGVTFEVTEKVRLNDDFRYDNFRLPSNLLSATVTWAMPGGTLLTPVDQITPTTATSFTAAFMGQKSFSNLIQVQFTPSKRLGGNLGYRYRHRHWFKAEPEVLPTPEAPSEPFEGDTFDINEHAAVAGVFFLPMDSLRINADVDLATFDNFITRVSPRQQQIYKVRARYQPRRWATLAGTSEIVEARNGESDTLAKQHYRNFGFIASLLPAGRWGVDLSYNYTSALQDAFICFNGSFAPPGTVAGACPTFSTTDNNNPNLIYSAYDNTMHFFSSRLMFRPIKQLTAALGYGLTKTDGTATILNSLQPFGPLQFTYQQPLASLSYEFVKGWSANAYWNYDQYNENGGVGPTNPRYFHDNRTVLSLKYAF